MRVVKEKVVGTRGSWVFRARLIEYVTKERGKFNRAELVMEKMGDDDVGFSLEDLDQMRGALHQFAAENFCV
jgi:hypothetical protein